MKVRIKCDRCKKMIDGIRTETMTGGFYSVRPGGYWHKFANHGEKNICDACMWANKKFQKIYGKMVR